MDSALELCLAEIGILAVVITESGYGVFRMERSMRSKLEERIRLVAAAGSYAINHPLPSEEPLEGDEVSIAASVYFEIWSDVDVDTANLVLNLVSTHRRRWWQPWTFLHQKAQRVLGIRIDGHDTAQYRRHIERTDVQPFEDHATFKWRGKRKAVDLGGEFWLELALETGRPSGVFRAVLDSRLAERGSTTAL